MNKEFIPYEQALELKELGFDEPCLAKYTVIPEDEIDWFTIPEQGITDKTSFGSSKNYNSKSFEEEGTISAPLYQQVFRWFREKYDLVHEISWSKYKGGLNFDYDIFSLVLPTDDELGDEDDVASDKSMETYDSLVDKGFRHHESNTYEEAELACINKLIEIVKDGTKINTRED